MKKATHLIFIILSGALLSGCRGMVSEMEKSHNAAAKPTVVVDNQEFQLDAQLSRKPRPDGKGFDLTGTIEVSSPGGNVTNQIHYFTLKPSWKGWPFYYVVGFARRGNDWVLPGIYVDKDPNFSGASRTTNGVFLIEFTWLNQGRGAGAKPEHFTAYDVSVDVPDAKGNAHFLAKHRVATE